MPTSRSRLDVSRTRSGAPAGAGAAGPSGDQGRRSAPRGGQKTARGFVTRLPLITPSPGHSSYVSELEREMERSRELERNQTRPSLTQVAPRQGQLSAAPIPADVRATERAAGTRQQRGGHGASGGGRRDHPDQSVGNDSRSHNRRALGVAELRLVVYSRFSDPAPASSNTA